ncbi:DUF2993 domain-containing protein [Frigoribacterium sp. CFBP9030]|uniref:LmeA family phospholipid-binding protein n=1 Tax=Frigoribacterium sp. CFBP9030 TaxID=3096537 RepID=UPI002A6AD136|nr:DUF2993 domain-containing protein [Frigoribacterium sp. CFBP9030]MDY0892887.1 DUF2993 domain-containing protein [Frigoribacterium sp. CFBP9030]
MTASDGAGAARPGRRRGRVVVIVALVLAVLVGLLVVADVVTRDVLEDRASAEIETTSGIAGVEVDIHGTSMLWQLVRGSLDSVTLSSGSESEPLRFRVDVVDVPTDLVGATGAATGTVSADAATVNRLDGIRDSGGAVTFGDREVTYTKSFAVPIIGDVPVDVSASAAVADEGRAIAFTPTAASLPDTSFRLDLSRFLGDFATTVCVAEYLPTGAAITAVDVAPGRASIDLSSPGLDLSEPVLDDEATCS